MVVSIEDVNVEQGAKLTTGAAAEAADKIESAAVGLPLSGQLADLAAALRALAGSRPDTARVRQWAAIDLFGVFLGESNDNEADGPRDRVSRFLAIAVQVLVFLPIGWTWVGLFSASEAYRAAATAGALHGESFLQGWETGFAGRLLPLFVFDKLALGTSLLVIALIAVTVVHAIRDRVYEDRAATRRHRLNDALLRADLVLAPYRLPAPEQAALGIDDTLARLAGTVDAIEAAGQAAAETQAKAIDAVTAAISALDSVERAVTSAATAAATLERAPDRLGEHLDQLATATARVGKAERALVNSTADASAQIADALRDGADQLRDSVATVGAAAANYASRTELAADILGQARQAVDALPAAVRALRADVANMGTQLAGLTQTLAAMKSLQGSMDAMRHSLDAAQRTLNTPTAAPHRRGFLARMFGR